MLIGKYIFVIFLSLFIIRSFRGIGFGTRPHQDFEIWHFPINFCKKGCFVSFDWCKCNFATFGRPCKNMFGPPLQNSLLAPSRKKSLRRPCLGVHAHLSKCWRGTRRGKVWEPLDRIFSGFGFHTCVANRIRIRIPTSWIRTRVGLEKTWVRTPLVDTQCRPSLMVRSPKIRLLRPFWGNN